MLNAFKQEQGTNLLPLPEDTGVVALKEFRQDVAALCREFEIEKTEKLSPSSQDIEYVATLFKEFEQETS